MTNYPIDMAAKPTQSRMTTERPHVVGVRLNDREMEAVRERAEAEGLKPGPFFRRVVLLYLEEISARN